MYTFRAKPLAVAQAGSPGAWQPATTPGRGGGRGRPPAWWSPPDGGGRSPR